MVNKQLAYVTVLTNSSYLPGVWVLNQSLREVGSQYDLYVLVPENRKAELSEQLSRWELPILTAPAVEVPEDLLERMGKDSYWNETFFKLRIAGLTQFEKIVLLDSDMLILRNIDHLFEKPSLSAVGSGQSLIPEWKGLNSGLIVLEPSKEFEAHLLSSIRPAIEQRLRENSVAGDQDVFNYALPEWPDREELHLPEEYNVMCWQIDALCRKFIPGGYKGVYIAHFTGGYKPWNCRTIDYFKRFYHAVAQRYVVTLRVFLRYMRYLREMKRSI